MNDKTLSAEHTFGHNAAAALIRRKIAGILADKEMADKQAIAKEPSLAPVSKHEQYLYDLLNSNKTLPQTIDAWHAYYEGLQETEKKEVWQEFYATNQEAISLDPPEKSLPETPYRSLFRPAPVAAVAADEPTSQPAAEEGAFSRRSQLHSLLFGFNCSLVVVAVLMFGFFNELAISPFIQPSRSASSTPIIVDLANAKADKSPEILIPKLNVEIPVDYSQTSISKQAIEQALDNGIVHYPSTVRPGQAGNAAFFGHSSNNIFNPGKYKFAFVLLHKLEKGDTFYLKYEGTNYAYEVISSRIVKPTEVGVLGPVAGETATATLITCNPPGTSINRLVVVGRQVSPDPAQNTPTPAAATPQFASSEPANDLPGNGPTLWTRFWGSIF